MKDYLRRLAEQADHELARTCLVREYLQARILECERDLDLVDRDVLCALLQ